MWVFLVAALPYVIPMLFIANPWEIRLWVPVILLLMLLKLNAVKMQLEPTGG